MFFISQGTVEVMSDDEKSVVATLSEGEFFGEISVVYGRRLRTASVR